MKNLLVAQSGGPTVAINSTVYGIIKRAKKEKEVDDIYAAKFGVKGLLKEDFLKLNDYLDSQFELLLQTPASALGSCRYKLKNVDENEKEYEKILNIFRKYSIRYFIYIGGNDSMDTVLKISEYFKLKNVNDIFIIGAPKTIDNDLLVTDHCPGFGSAAKYVATTFAEIERDCAVYDINAVTIVETMGRDAGWLTAASSLARNNGGCGPDLIYCCERYFEIEKFLETIEMKLKEKPNILVAVSEGLKNKKGQHILDDGDSFYKSKDMFGHKINAGVARLLSKVVEKQINCKVRAVELNLPQRAAIHICSKTDIKEAVLVGEKAVEMAVEGKTAKMVIIIRENQEKYSVSLGETSVKNVANLVKQLPLEYITKDGTNITPKAIRYLKPLILGEMHMEFKDGIPKFFKFF